LMRQAHKEMNPATAAALNSFGLVEYSWCNVGESPCRFKFQVRARITKPWLVKNQENSQTFGLLVHMTEELYHLWYSIDEGPWADCVLNWGLYRQQRLQWFPYFQHYWWYLTFKNYHECWKALMFHKYSHHWQNPM
jgi:hypothetical protein